MFVAPYPNYWHNTATQHDYANHSQTIGYEGAWDPKCPPERWAVHVAMIQTSCMPQTTTSQCQKETPEHTEDLNAEYKDEHQEMQDEWKQEFQHTTEIYCKACQTWLNGPRQWQDHTTGKDHGKSVRNAQRANATDTQQRKAIYNNVARGQTTRAEDWLEYATLKLTNTKPTKSALRTARRKQAREKREAEQAADRS